MPYRFTQIGVVAVFFAGPGAALAQTAALDAYKSEVAALRADVAALKLTLLGAVVAFDRQKAQPCPDGWRPFEPAGGRVIVGAGFNKNASKSGTPLFQRPSHLDDEAAAIGGEERWTLTEAQMPPHQHGVYPHAGYTASGNGDLPPSGAIEGAGGGDAKTHVWPNITSVTGGGKPFDIMPPFVALYYCIKE